MDSGLRRNDIRVDGGCRNGTDDMTLYAIFDPRPGRPALPAAIPESFSWLAALLPPVFFLRHALWIELLLFAVKLAALIFIARYIGDDAAFLIYCLVALWLGFAAPGLRRAALSRRGWIFRGERVALSVDLAQLEALA
tara:strand:+ start:29358 stop:29771 length:414 start_codon:yes stop_codon:yes gene_type:complete